jgi:hypothetical protein
MVRVRWALVKMKVLAYEGRAGEQRLKARFIKTVVAVCLKAYPDTNPQALAARTGSCALSKPLPAALDYIS